MRMMGIPLYHCGSGIPDGNNRAASRAGRDDDAAGTARLGRNAANAHRDASAKRRVEAIKAGNNI